MVAFANISSFGEIQQVRRAVAAPGLASLRGLDEQGCASPITARLIRNGQAHRAMRVKFPARFLNRLDQDWITFDRVIVNKGLYRFQQSCRPTYNNTHRRSHNLTLSHVVETMH